MSQNIKKSLKYTKTKIKKTLKIYFLTQKISPNIKKCQEGKKIVKNTGNARKLS